LGALYFDKGAPIILSLKEEGIGLSVKDDRGGPNRGPGRGRNGDSSERARYLAQALKALDGMAGLKVKGPGAPMMFSVEGYRILVMPVALAAVRKAEAVVQ